MLTQAYIYNFRGSFYIVQRATNAKNIDRTRISVSVRVKVLSIDSALRQDG